MAGKICVVEVERDRPDRQPGPRRVHLPGIYVHRIVLNATPEKRIEKRTTKRTQGADPNCPLPGPREGGGQGPAGKPTPH